MSNFIFGLIGILAVHLIGVLWQLAQGRRRRAAANLIFGVFIALGAACIDHSVREFDSAPVTSIAIAIGGALIASTAGWQYSRWLRAPGDPLRMIQLPHFTLPVHADEIRTPDADPLRIFGYSYDWSTGQIASRRIVLRPPPTPRFRRIRWLNRQSQSDAIEVHYVLYDSVDAAERSLLTASVGTLGFLRATGVYMPTEPALVDKSARGIVLTRWLGNDWGDGVPSCYQAALSSGSLAAYVCGDCQDTVQHVALSVRSVLVDVSSGATPL